MKERPRGQPWLRNNRLRMDARYAFFAVSRALPKSIFGADGSDVIFQTAFCALSTMPGTEIRMGLFLRRHLVGFISARVACLEAN